jgi:radical SAM protein with 4Fe4S-binding SPASM domain
VFGQKGPDVFSSPIEYRNATVRSGFQKNHHREKRNLIEVKNISKSFKLYGSPADRLKEIILRRSFHREFQALKDISFRVGEGETLGIVGQNGAGKTTLLKILTKVLLPDSGVIHVNGRTTGLLELGTGFNPEFTGLQNIFYNGTLLGMTKDEINGRLDAIKSFSELGDFINESIKTYSSGMVMRLAFSVAIHADPKAFVVDEALSVGDAYFQQKCMRRIAEFKNNGGSIVFVSHDMNAVKVLCDFAILLDKGRMIDSGEPKDTIDFYQSMILKKSHQGDIKVKIKKIESPKIKSLHKNEVSTGEVELVDFRLLDKNNEETSYIISEDLLTIKFKIKSTKYLIDPHYGIMIRNALGQSIFETNTYCMGMKTEPLDKDYVISVCYKFICNLVPADYSISVGVANKGYDKGNFEEYLFLCHDVDQIKVIVNDTSIFYGGVFNIRPEVTIKPDSHKDILAQSVVDDTLALKAFFSNPPIINIHKMKQHCMVHNKFRPIMIICETINICNSNCIICSYSKMSRKKEIMSMNTFQKVLVDYSEMGGGAFSLTPVVGDVFLDSFLPDRVKLLKKHNTIKPLSVTTNLLALEKHSIDDLKEICEVFDIIHISIYGLDAHEYLKLTKKNNYDLLVQNIKRLLQLCDDESKVRFGFRLLKKRRSEEIERWINDCFGILIKFGYTWEYSNWSVLDSKTTLPYDAKWLLAPENRKQCAIPLVACQIFSNGDVSFCHCSDFNIDSELLLGSVNDNSLLEIYNSEKTRNLWQFNKNIPEFCLKCSFYKPIEYLNEHEYAFDNPTEFIGG